MRRDSGHRLSLPSDGKCGTPRRRLHVGMPARCMAQEKAVRWGFAAWFAEWKLGGGLPSAVRQSQQELRSTTYNDNLPGASDLKLPICDN